MLLYGPSSSWSSTTRSSCSWCTLRSTTCSRTLPRRWVCRRASSPTCSRRMRRGRRMRRSRRRQRWWMRGRSLGRSRRGRRSCLIRRWLYLCGCLGGRPRLRRSGSLKCRKCITITITTRRAQRTSTMSVTTTRTYTIKNFPIICPNYHRITCRLKIITSRCRRATISIALMQSITMRVSRLIRRETSNRHSYMISHK